MLPDHHHKIPHFIFGLFYNYLKDNIGATWLSKYPDKLKKLIEKKVIDFFK